MHDAIRNKVRSLNQLLHQPSLYRWQYRLYGCVVGRLIALVRLEPYKYSRLDISP